MNHNLFFSQINLLDKRFVCWNQIFLFPRFDFIKRLIWINVNFSQFPNQLVFFTPDFKTDDLKRVIGIFTGGLQLICPDEEFSSDQFRCRLLAIDTIQS
jgi:hypothetical protein